MKITPDITVLGRALVRDDPDQASQAMELLEQGNPTPPGQAQVGKFAPAKGGAIHPTPEGRQVKALGHQQQQGRA